MLELLRSLRNGIRGRLPGRAALLAVALIAVAPSLALAQVGGDPGGGTPPPAEPPITPPAGPTEEEQAAAAAAAEAARLLAEKQKRICELFAATQAEFNPEGQIVITYGFDEGDQSIAADWGPEIDTFKKRVRWSRGWEGGAGAHYRESIVLAEHGIWLHKAMWKDVAMDIQFQSLTEIMKPGDLVAAIFAWDKNKKLAGSNMGEQCIRVDSSLRPNGAPIPTKYPVLTSAEERTFGYKLKDGLLAATTSGRVVVDTGKNEKFLSKLGPGHAGVAWRGDYMKGYLVKVVLTGTLDPEWIEKALAGAS